MDLNKIYEFFQPEKVTQKLHIIGCGSVGSTVAENLVRCGLKRIVLWDMDVVEPHNIANQMFTAKHVNMPKVEALKEILLEINPELEITTQPDGWKGQNLSGYLFLCVDSIELRREIVEKFMNNTFIKAVFDFRTGLTDAQHYAADWASYSMKENLLKTMQFSHDEASQETPTSACGITLGVATTVRIISALGVNNFLNFAKGKGIKKMISVGTFDYVLDAF